MAQAGIGVEGTTDPNQGVGVPGAGEGGGEGGEDSHPEETTPYNPPVEEGGTGSQ